MEEGEIATFEAVSAYSARSTQQVTIEKGPLYRYADYNLGTYLTEPYYISYGSVRATAYFVQPAKPGPGSGNYTITKIGDNQALAKVVLFRLLPAVYFLLNKPKLLQMLQSLLLP